MVLLEKAKADECLDYAVKAEEMGFDHVWVDDHFFLFAPTTECGFSWCFMALALQGYEESSFCNGGNISHYALQSCCGRLGFATKQLVVLGQSRSRCRYW